MAEQTPGNLTGMFGGYVLGRAANNNRGIDATIERLEQQLSKLNDTLQRFTSSLDAQAKATNGAPAGMGTAQSSARMGNGGAVSFGSHAPSSHRADVVEPRWTGGGGYQGRHSAGAHSGNGGGWSFGGGGGGGSHADRPTSHSGGFPQQVSGMYQQAGGRVGIGKRMAGGAAVGLAVYTAGHYSNQVTMQSIAAQYTFGRNANTDAVYRPNYTAASNADAAAAVNMVAGQAGFALGSRGFNQAYGSAQAASMVDPSITNVQGAQAMLSLGSASSVNMMRGMGINTLGRDGRADPVRTARQIVAATGQNARTEGQVAAAFGPRGSITLTLNSMVQNGYLDANAARVVAAHARGMMKARVGGMGYRDYARQTRILTTTEKGSDEFSAARERLRDVGINTSLVAQERTREGEARTTERETIGGFEKGLRATTETLSVFRRALNKILSIGILGDVVGGASAVTGTVPGINRILPSGSGLGGDGPASASAYNTFDTAVSSPAGFGAVGGSGPKNDTGRSRMSTATPARSGGSTGVGAAAAARRYGPDVAATKPHVQAAAALIGPMFGVRTIHGVASRSGPSDHPLGLALDFMCGKSQGDRIAAYCLANAGKLSIKYVIWQQRIWQRSNPRWTKMADRGSVTANHYDHVHVSFLGTGSSNLSGMPGAGSAGALNMGSAQQATEAATAAMGASSPGMGTSGGGAQGWGGFSEVASLGLGGGSAGAAGGSGGPASPLTPGGSGVLAAGGSDFSGPGGGVRSGTYNIHNSTSNAQTKRDLLKLMKSADVLSLTEWVGKKRGLADWIRKQGWGVSQGPGDTANIYDLDDYERVRGGSRKLNTLTGARGGTRSRYAQYDLLRDKDSGMEFWQVGAHAVPLGKGRNNPLRKRIQQQQFRALEDLVGDLGGNVLVAGDFNNRRPGLAGMQSSSGRIDSVLYGGGASLTGRQTIGGLSSDHPAVLAQVAFGGGGAAGLQGGGPAANKRLGQAMAAARGWSGAQWNALLQLWNRESGWRTNADNPTSSAYGIPQAMTSVHDMPKGYMSDPRIQIQWGLNYIANRYGNPANAWRHSQRVGWYEMGEWNIANDQNARVHKGEMIIPTKVAEAVRNELTAPGMKGGRGGGVNITFSADAIKISLGGNPSKAEARSVGTWVVDAIMEDRRIKDLQNG